nr:C2 calcium/lipid-binding domain, CaLB [Tanacetum cinerariifolium]
MSIMEDDLFTYEGYDPSDVAFTEWLGSNFFNYKTMDQYTKKALWIYLIRGDDEVELTNEEFSDNEDDVAEEPTPVKHTCKPFNYKSRCSEWPTCSWRENGYCNGGNFPGAYHIGNLLHYQNLEFYKALKDSDLKEQALWNKAIMEGSISDDESCNDCWKRWKSHEITYHDHAEIEYENETHDNRQELCEAHKLPMCNIRKFEMIKYSFGQNEEYVVVKEDEYDDLARTSNDAYRTYMISFAGWTNDGWLLELNEEKLKTSLT